MKKPSTGKAKREKVPEIDFAGGVRGKYAERYAAAKTIVVLAPNSPKDEPAFDVPKRRRR